MSRSSIVIMALAAVAMAGTASAQTAVQARFDVNQQTTAAANYAAFANTANAFASPPS